MKTLRTCFEKLVSTFAIRSHRRNLRFGQRVTCDFLRGTWRVVSSHIISLVAAVVVLTQVTQSCVAALILTLSSDAGDLSHITPGSTFTVSVGLSQLENVDQLDSLAGTVVFDPALLGIPAITKGEIIPDPLDDPLDFLSLAESGTVDVAFSTLSIGSASHITRNGIFYSFTVEALGPGAGNFSIDFADGTRFNAADPTGPFSLEVLTGAAMPFTVVPEPGSTGIAARGLILFLILGRRSRINVLLLVQGALPK